MDLPTCNSSMESVQPSFHMEPAQTFSTESVQYFPYTNQPVPGNYNTHLGYQSQYSYGGEEMMEDDFDEETLRQMQDDTGEKDYFAQQLSMKEYEKQTKEYTQSAVEALTRSPEYQRVYTRCQLCWCSWSENQCSESCMECGGFAMRRPCPICNGKCNSQWTREVQMSHSAHEAHWDGECTLPLNEREGYMCQALIDDVSEDSLLDGIEDLTT